MAKRKSTKGKQRSTRHTHKTKDRVTRTPLWNTSKLHSTAWLIECIITI